MLKSLLESMPLDGIEAVTAGAGYLSRRNCDLIEALGARPYIKIRKNVRSIRAFGSKAWVNMILEWMSNREVWKRRYGMRSSAENAFSAIKRRFEYRLASIRRDLQRKELMTEVLAYNLNILEKID
jgi:transposase